MIKELDLGKMELEELKKLHKDTGKAIEDFESRRQRDALAAARATAKEHGFSLEELLSGKIKKSKPQPLPVKYRNPENSDQTWSGRGRQPNWVKEVLSAGKSLDTMAV